MDGKKSVLSLFRLNRRFKYLFLSLFFLQIEVLVPALCLVITRKPVPIALSYISTVIGTVAGVAFMVMYLWDEEGRNVKDFFKTLWPCLLNGVLLYSLAGLSYALVFGKFATSSYLNIFKGGSSAGFLVISILALLIMFTTIWFTMVYLNRLVKARAGLKDCTFIYIETLKDFFKKTHISLGVSVLLGAALTLAVVLINLLSEFKYYHLTGDLLSLGVVYVLETYLLTYIVLVFFNISDIYLTGKKETVNMFPFVTVGLLVAVIALFLFVFPGFKYSTADNIIYDTATHKMYGDIYLENGDYHNAVYEYNIALSENRATKAYVDYLIARKNNLVLNTTEEFNNAFELCPNNAFINLLYGRYLLLNDNPDKAIETLEPTLHSAQVTDAQFMTLLDAYNRSEKADKNKALNLVPILLDRQYYFDPYSDLERLSLNRLYDYQKALENQKEELTLCDNWFHAKAFDLMAFSSGDQTSLEAGKKVLAEWVNTLDSMEANYYYSKIFSQYAYEGQYNGASDKAARFAELYEPSGETERIELYKYVAAVMIECDDFTKCEDYLKDKYTLNHKLAIYYAYSQYSQRKFDDAVKLCGELINSDPNDYEAIYIRGLANYESNKYAEGMADMKVLDGALKETKDPEVRNFIDDSFYMFAVRNNYLFANNMNNLEEFGLSEDDLFVQYLKAYYHYGQNSYEEMTEAADKALAYRDDLYSIHWIKGMAYHNQEEFSNAAKEYARAGEIDDKAEIHFHLGFMYKELGKYGRAIREFNIVRTLLPQQNHRGSDTHGYSVHSWSQLTELKDHLGEVE